MKTLQHEQVLRQGYRALAEAKPSIGSLGTGDNEKRLLGAGLLAAGRVRKLASTG
jgi:hypothetical protein